MFLISDTMPVTILSHYTCFPLIPRSSRKVIPAICSLAITDCFFLVIENTQSGTAVINDTMIQAAGSSTLLMTFRSPTLILLLAEILPFGGIGPSGCKLIVKMVISSYDPHPPCSRLYLREVRIRCVHASSCDTRKSRLVRDFSLE